MYHFDFLCILYCSISSIPVPSHCAIPSQQDVDHGKACPSNSVPLCVDGNIGYATLPESWKKCGTVSECGFVMRGNDGKFYLRRANDPDIDAAAGTWGYTYCGMLNILSLIFFRH